VVEWNAVPRYSTSGVNNGQGALTFQAILHEGTNEITFQYLDLEGVDATGASATIGIEYSGGTGGVLHAHNQPYSVREGMALRFVPGPGPTPTPDPALKCLPDVYYFPWMASQN
jgi:hypothetical protein